MNINAGFIDIPSGERLYEDGRLQNLKSGNGVLVMSFRRPLIMSGQFYYRMREGKYVRVEKMVREYFGIEIKTTRKWFDEVNAFITPYNADLKRIHDETELERERERKRKQKAMQNLLDGRITRRYAESILGREAVEQLLSNDPKGTMRRREYVEPDYESFNEFTSSDDLGELDSSAWGF